MAEPGTLMEALPSLVTESSAAAGIAIIIGLLLVFLGRRLFWVFVGGIGFLAGMQFAPTLVPDQSQWITLLIGLGLGVVGAVLAIVLQRVAVAVAGWFAGGMLATRLAVEFGWTDQTAAWLAFIIGAVIAAVVVFILFDWALIALTTLSGAVVISDAVTFTPAVEWLIAVLLVIAGAVVQARGLIKPSAALPAERAS